MFDWNDFFHRHRDPFIEEWVRRLKNHVSEHYLSRPVEELFGTVGQAYDANYHVIVNDDYSYINEFIDVITKLRLDAGFPLNDVQMAFELFRNIVLPYVIDECPKDDLPSGLQKVNTCLAYTIHRFSVHFQNMHKRHLQEYAATLERDVKERTDELQNSEQKYKSLVNEMNDGYIVMQGDIISLVNPAFCKMHGYRSREVVGKPFTYFISPASRDNVMDIIRRNLNGLPSSHVCEYYRMTKEGERLPTEITVRRSFYNNDQYSLCLCRDITERVRMEQKMREAERMAYIGKITASLSHEIRNPLSAVKMNLQLLTKKADLVGNNERRLEISVKQVHRLERILTELLDFAKPMSFNLQPIRINHIITECAELFETKCQDKGIALEISLDQRIPLFQGDPEKIEQVVINLLLNAIDSSKRGGAINISSQLKNENGNAEAEILVGDEGECIPENRLTDIFKPFYTTKNKGTGLGLANVKRIADALGGRVAVQNRSPRGVVFNVSLPLGDHHG